MLVVFLILPISLLVFHWQKILKDSVNLLLGLFRRSNTSTKNAKIPPARPHTQYLISLRGKIPLSEKHYTLYYTSS